MAILDNPVTYIDGVDVVHGQDITDTQETAIYAKDTVNKLGGGTTYNSSTVYEYPNTVVYNNSGYMYINSTPSAGHLPTDTTYWKLLVSSPTNQMATSDTLGGVKADPKTSSDTQEVHIDPTTGKLYTQPSGSGGSSTIIRRWS